jgi:hypothetical protein
MPLARNLCGMAPVRECSGCPSGRPELGDGKGKRLVGRAGLEPATGGL